MVSFVSFIAVNTCIVGRNSRTKTTRSANKKGPPPFRSTAPPSLFLDGGSAAPAPPPAAEDEYQKHYHRTFLHPAIVVFID